ncbi:nucleotide exchange factor GrpE [bacterium]|nr:nucleotide exchange factor GrpE [bacterium]
MTKNKKNVKKVQIVDLETEEAEVIEEPVEDKLVSACEADEIKEPDNFKDLEEKLAAMTENWQRERANFQNFKRRIEDEKKELRKYASYDLAFDLLKVIDYFESSVSFAENLPPEAQNVIIGVEYTLKELVQILSAHGITPIKIKEGDTFDSSLMEASERVIKEDVEAETVVEVQRDGWMYHDRILRSPQVIVAVGPHEPKGGDVVEGGEND